MPRSMKPMIVSRSRLLYLARRGAGDVTDQPTTSVGWRRDRRHDAHREGMLLDQVTPVTAQTASPYHPASEGMSHHSP
jgi:hypothetical protein